MCDACHRHPSGRAVWSGCRNPTERSSPMQATYSPRRSSAGMLTAVMVFLAALILGGAGGYVLKGATGISVGTTTVRATSPAIYAPASTQVNPDTSGDARGLFRRAN